jgi:hypothetical protein
MNISRVTVKGQIAMPLERKTIFFTSIEKKRDKPILCPEHFL